MVGDPRTGQTFNLDLPLFVSFLLRKKKIPCEIKGCVCETSEMCDGSRGGRSQHFIWKLRGMRSGLLLITNGVKSTQECDCLRGSAKLWQCQTLFSNYISQVCVCLPDYLSRCVSSAANCHKNTKPQHLASLSSGSLQPLSERLSSDDTTGDVRGPCTWERSCCWIR